MNAQFIVGIISTLLLIKLFKSKMADKMAAK